MRKVSEQELQYYTDNIKLVADTFLQPSPDHKKNFYCCPSCGSGTRKGSGALHIYGKDGGKSAGFYCFSCKQHGRSVDLVEMVANTDFRGAIQLLRQEIGHEFTDVETGNHSPWFNKRPKTQKKEFDEDEKPVDTSKLFDYTKFYWGCCENLKRAGWKEVRGIPLEICLKYKVGYCPKWTMPPACKGAEIDETHGKHPTARYILPYSKYHYFARACANSPYGGNKLKTNTPIPLGYYLYEEMKKEEPKVLFVVEGEFDALSVITAGGHAVGLAGAARAEKFCKKFMKDKLPAVLVIGLDNDKSGVSNGDRLEKIARENNVPYIRANISGKYNDPNDFLRYDRNGFFETVRAIKEKAEELYQKPTQNITTKRIDNGQQQNNDISQKR